jgi:hypothetical protein
MADVTGTYYAGEAFIGYGAELLVGQGDGSPETFVAVADIVSITPGEMTTGVIPKTHLRSPGRHHEKLATIRDSGPFTIMANWRPGHGSQSNNPAGGDGFDPGRSLLQLWRNVTEANFSIRLPGTVGSPEILWPFRGTVTRFQPGGLVLDQKVDLTVEITPLQDYSADLP